jgi:ribonuclease-3
MSKSSLGNLEQAVGYKFQNISLLERAVTHRSWAYEKMPFGDDAEIRGLQNESLEFVGDSVLGLAVTEQLFLLHQAASEGDLSLMKHHLVSMGTLAALAKKLDLGTYMRVGRGEEKSGGRKKDALLADILEAVIAAIFFDGGYVPARAFVRRIYGDRLRKATPKTSLDYKTLLQETLQGNGRPAPVYKLAKTEGLPHELVFHVEVSWDAGCVKAKGTSIKSAEMQGASLALKKINKEKTGDVKDTAAANGKATPDLNRTAE